MEFRACLRHPGRGVVQLRGESTVELYFSDFKASPWRLLSVPWTARRSNQSILKEISPAYSLKEPMLKLKLQSFGHLMQRTDSFKKDPDAGKNWRQEKGMTKDEMVRCHHQLDGHEFEQALGVRDGQGSLQCCSAWGCKESDTTEWTELNCTEISLL